jgi:hypothetical protein
MGTENKDLITAISDEMNNLHAEKEGVGRAIVRSIILELKNPLGARIVRDNPEIERTIAEKLTREQKEQLNAELGRNSVPQSSPIAAPPPLGFSRKLPPASTIFTNNSSNNPEAGEAAESTNQNMPPPSP